MTIKVQKKNQYTYEDAISTIETNIQNFQQARELLQKGDLKSLLTLFQIGTEDGSWTTLTNSLAYNRSVKEKLCQCLEPYLPKGIHFREGSSDLFALFYQGRYIGQLDPRKRQIHISFSCEDHAESMNTRLHHMKERIEKDRKRIDKHIKEFKRWKINPIMWVWRGRLFKKVQAWLDKREQEWQEDVEEMNKYAENLPETLKKIEEKQQAIMELGVRLQSLGFELLLPEPNIIEEEEEVCYA